MHYLPWLDCNINRAQNRGLVPSLRPVHISRAQIRVSYQFGAAPVLTHSTPESRCQSFFTYKVRISLKVLFPGQNMIYLILTTSNTPSATGTLRALHPRDLVVLASPAARIDCRPTMRILENPEATPRSHINR